MNVIIKYTEFIDGSVNDSVASHTHSTLGNKAISELLNLLAYCFPQRVSEKISGHSDEDFQN